MLQLTVDDPELVARLLHRATETGRSDDNESVIRHRLDLYHEQTQAVLDQYDPRGIVTKVQGTGSVDDVTERAVHALTNHRALSLTSG